MSDFEPSDSLTTEITSHASQAYSLSVPEYPSLIKLAMWVVSEEPEPIIVKVTKKGVELPIKEYRGLAEIVDMVEV